MYKKIPKTCDKTMTYPLYKGKSVIKPNKKERRKSHEN